MNKIKLQIILEPTVFHVYFYVSKTLVWNTDPWRLPSDFLIHILTLLCNHWQFSPLLYRSGSVIVNSLVTVNQTGDVTKTSGILQQYVSSGVIGNLSVEPRYNRVSLGGIQFFFSQLHFYYMGLCGHDCKIVGFSSTCTYAQVY